MIILWKRARAPVPCADNMTSCQLSVETGRRIHIRSSFFCLEGTQILKISTVLLWWPVGAPCVFRWLCLVSRSCLSFLIFLSFDIPFKVYLFSSLLLEAQWTSLVMLEGLCGGQSVVWEGFWWEEREREREEEVSSFHSSLECCLSEMAFIGCGFHLT